MVRRAASVLGGLALALTILAAGVHTAAWFWAESLLEQGLAARLDGLRAEGWTIGASAPVRSGWPLAAALDLSAVSAANPALAGGLAWRADRVRIEVSALHPQTVLIVPAGTQSIGLGGMQAVEYVATGLHAAVPLDRPDRMRVQAASLHVGAPADLVLRDVTGLLTPDAAAVSVLGVTLPDSVQWALGRQVEALSLDVMVAGVQPGMALRDTRGKLLLRHLALRWGPLGVQGTGLGSLDAARQPVLGGTVRVRGAAETLAALRTAGVLNPNQAVAAGAMLGLLLRGTGPAGEIELPIALQDGLFSLGKVPVARLPAWAWPPA